MYTYQLSGHAEESKWASLYGINRHLAKPPINEAHADHCNVTDFTVEEFSKFFIWQIIVSLDFRSNLVVDFLNTTCNSICLISSMHTFCMISMHKFCMINI